MIQHGSKIPPCKKCSIYGVICSVPLKLKVIFDTPVSIPIKDFNVTAFHVNPPKQYTIFMKYTKLHEVISSISPFQKLSKKSNQ